jgi:hypothetical protein
MTAAEFRVASAKPAAAHKRAKFNNKIVHADEGRFDSTEEYKRFLVLRLMERAGEIADLQRQVKFSLDAGGIHINDYVADFVYMKDGEQVVEDSKGHITPEYRQKRRLMKEILGIDILETGRAMTKPKQKKRAK